MSIPLDWLPMCPEEFRQRFKEIAEHPPGTPEGARYFNYGEPPPLYDTVSGIDATDPAESRKNSDRRKFAQAWGQYAEVIVARHIIMQGLPLREWDWRPAKGLGEIDLITQRGNRIIFIEVKARDGKKSDPWEAITPAKIRELCRGAHIYLRSQTVDYEYQFDVALISGRYDDYTLEYIEDAFMCPLTGGRR